MSFARIKVLCGTAVYIAAFLWAYIEILATVYGYEGFRYNSDPVLAAKACSLSLAPAFWIPTRFGRPSQVVYWILYLFVVVPTMVVTVYSYRGTSTEALFSCFTILGAFGLLSLIYKVPLSSLPRLRLQQQQFWIGVIILSVLFYAVIFASFGVHFGFTSLSEVYTLRSQYKRTLSSLPSLVEYAVDWQSYVLNPMLIALGLISRRKAAVVVGVVGQILIYQITGFRTVLFSATFLFVLFITLRSSTRFATRLLFTWAAAIALSTVLYLRAGSLLLCGLVVQRLTGLPGLLTGFYFLFFSSHPKMLLSHSIFKHFIQSPYGMEPPLLIGTTYFPGSGTYANANLWADAFANFGYVGVFAFTGLLALVLWMYDSITVDHDLRFAALVLGIPAIALANAGLLTSLLTHGIGFAILVVYSTPIRVQMRHQPLSRFGSGNSVVLKTPKYLQMRVPPQWQ